MVGVACHEEKLVSLHSSALGSSHTEAERQLAPGLPDSWCNFFFMTLHCVLKSKYLQVPRYSTCSMVLENCYWDICNSKEKRGETQWFLSSMYRCERKAIFYLLAKRQVSRLLATRADSISVLLRGQWTTFFQITAVAPPGPRAGWQSPRLSCQIFLLKCSQSFLPQTQESLASHSRVIRAQRHRLIIPASDHNMYKRGVEEWSDLQFKMLCFLCYS